MRNATCQTLVELSRKSPFVFMTGDLGFMALEPLKEAMGDRFINAGVAEQNMIGVAAGIASTGLQAWAYSIAPFIYARPFEQIRNDVCLHDLDVKLVGNGGGYGYGPMGGTHHALEDYGALLTLQKMRAYVPAFAEDVQAMIPKMASIPHPIYLRLGRNEKPPQLQLPPYAPWRRLVQGGGALVLVVGPLAGPIIEAAEKLPEPSRPELWVLSELPLDIAPFPVEFLESLARRKHLVVAEEHVLQGSAGQMVAHALLRLGQAPPKFSHCHAKGYLSKTYGSQNFHRAESGLDAGHVLALAMSQA
jgi:transketolase